MQIFFRWIFHLQRSDEPSTCFSADETMKIHNLRGETEDYESPKTYEDPQDMDPVVLL